MVSKASDDFPEPDSPVTTVRALRGISTVMFLRLCSRAPRTISASLDIDLEPRWGTVSRSTLGCRRLGGGAVGRLGEWPRACHRPAAYPLTRSACLTPTGSLR